MKLLKAVLLVLLISPLQSHAGALILMVDGVRVRSTPAPVIRKGRMFVPASFFRKIGLAVEINSPREAMVGWPESDGIFRFKAGRSWVPGMDTPERIHLTSVPFVHRGTLMVPLNTVVGHGWTRVHSDMWTQWKQRSRTVSIFRSPEWLSWRLKMDEQLRREHPKWYETPIAARGS